MKILNVINFFKNLIFPQFCLGCGIIGFLLCENCKKYHIYLLDQQHCQVCKKPSKSGKTCKSCITRFCLNNVIVASVYDQIISSLIKSFKYAFNKDPTEILNDILIKQINNHCLITKNTIITFVPLTRNKLKSRGFNQAEILSRRIGLQLSIDVQDLLFKTRETKAQAHLSRQERLTNQNNAFRIKNPDFDKSKNILIIDDVISTGATLHECALVLRKAGAKKISALVIAQSL